MDGYYYPQQPLQQQQQQQQHPHPLPPPYNPHSPAQGYYSPSTGLPQPPVGPSPTQQGQGNTPDLPVDDLEEDDGEDDGGTPDGTGKKKGGRPRDKVWELFEGNRTVAKCAYCGWKTDHPKAFRMRTHVAACSNIPQDKKDDLARYQEDKEQKKAVKAEVAEQLGQGSPAGRPPPAKKAKRTANGDRVSNAGASTSRMALAPTPAPIVAPRLPTPPPPPLKRSPITCHVLDSTSGKPAPEMRIRLDRLNTTGFVLQAQGITDNDGRCGNLLPPGAAIEVGIFKITFFTNEYFTKRGILSFYPFIEIPFEVKSAEEHYHYTTYRGS